MRIYELYERQLAEKEVHDFDDLVLVAVRALREDAELRRRWQSRFWQVLVDEYQDIEPAQELLVRTLAAPQDGFFCVGDEDQTLYGWRRASVRRIIHLDLSYPGLQRVSLAHNYRCPEEIVDASRRLIEHNEVRFPKPIHAAPDRAPADVQALQLHEHAGQPQAADEIAGVLASRRRGKVVVLARTTNLLRTVALACAGLDVKISAPEPVFEPHGARGALEAYLRLCAATAGALPDDVARVFRAPSRGLPFGTEEPVAMSLRAGLTFTASLAGVPADGRQRARLEDAGQILDGLTTIHDARLFITYLRGPGGLDQYFRDYEQAFGETEKIDFEVLEQAQREAAGKTVAEYAELVQARSDALRAIRDDVRGIEPTTIHRAKGREWPEVHVFGCEEHQLPHRRALDVSEQERAAGEGLEAERRLAYVAFTRPGDACGSHHRDGREPVPDRGWVRADTPLYHARRPSPHGPEQYALRHAPKRSVAVTAAAAAIQHRMVGPDTASDRVTVAELLAAIEQLSDSERAAVLDATGLGDGDRPIVRLGKGARKGLARALRKLAGGGGGLRQESGEDGGGR